MAVYFHRTGPHTLTPTEHVSGAWDLDQQNNGRTFYEGTLRSNYVADASNTYSVVGTAGSIFAGLSFSFDNGTLFYNSEFADVINPQSGAQAALTYTNGAGNAGIVARGAGTNGSLVMFGFPFDGPLKYLESTQTAAR